MAGLGFKDFAVGEVLTAADVDGYLMQQSVMRFADSAARGSALGTAVGTGVPLAEGMVAYLDDVNRVEVYDGAVWKPSGAVLQVVSTTKTDTFSASVAAGGYTSNVTGLEAIITPSSSTSKVLLLVSIHGQSSSVYGHTYRLMRGATAIGIGDADGVRARNTASFILEAGDGDNLSNVTAFYLDSPATTSATTYGIQLFNWSSLTRTLYVNRGDTDQNNANTGLRVISSITAIEVAA